MKKGILLLFVVALCLPVLTAQNVKVKSTSVGTWKFEAPYAPEPYSAGTIVVGLAEKKHTANMSFEGSEYKIPGENVKAANDSVLFSVYLEGQDIQVMLKMVNDTTMTGKAVYSEGEVPLTLTRILKSEEK